MSEREPVTTVPLELKLGEREVVIQVPEVMVSAVFEMLEQVATNAKQIEALLAGYINRPSYDLPAQLAALAETERQKQQRQLAIDLGPWLLDMFPDLQYVEVELNPAPNNRDQNGVERHSLPPTVFRRQPEVVLIVPPDGQALPVYDPENEMILGPGPQRIIRDQRGEEQQPQPSSIDQYIEGSEGIPL